MIKRGKLGIEAFDAEDRSLGIFPNMDSAADAISKAASNTSQTEETTK
jgi:hypothetical protein